MRRHQPGTDRRPDAVLRADYERLKRETLIAVGARLRTQGIAYPEQDLEAFYNQAWHTLYERMVAGEDIGNRTGFLVQVAYRRAIDDFRRLRPDERVNLDAATLSAAGPDVVEELDDRRRLREFMEALRDDLDDRERMAATLCYVHGYSRPDAARAMGLSDRRMKKIMDTVSKAVGRATAQIEAGRRCEEWGSRTRAYGLGLLDPDGERHAAARAHLSQCSACRTEVLRLRGLAGVAPPPLLPWGLALGAAGGGAAGAGSGSGLRRLRPRDGGSKAMVAGAAAGVAVVAVAVALAIAAISSGGDDPPPAEVASATPPSTQGASSASTASRTAGSSKQPTSARAKRRTERERRGVNASAAAPAGAASTATGPPNASPARRPSPRRTPAAARPPSPTRTPAAARPPSPTRTPAAASPPSPTQTPAAARPPSPTPAPAAVSPLPPAQVASETPGTQTVATAPAATPAPEPSPADHQTIDESGTQEFGVEP